MIDLHTHVLHNLDDGARDLGDALEMVRCAVEDGVTVIAATPHGRSAANVGLTRYSVALLHERLAELRAAIAELELAVEIVPGTEIFGEPGVVERLEAGELLPYANSRAVLLEFPLNITREAAAQLIWSFQRAGRRVVIAHPERYRFVQDEPNNLVALIERGALMQLTGDALLGNQGERLRRIAELMLEHGMVQLLASDAHGTHLRRLPNLAQARRRAAQLVGETAAEQLTRTIPAAIIADEPIRVPDPSPVRKRFGFW